MPDLSHDQIAELEARINADPRIREKILANREKRRTGTGWDVFTFDDPVRDAGFEIPHDYSYRLGADGRITVSKDSFLQRNQWIWPAALLSGGAAGVISGSGAGAASAAGAGGVGIGETGAVTGLSGSGFGGGGAAAGIGSRLIDAGARAGLMGLGQRFGRGQQEIPQEVRDILDQQRQQTEIQTQRMQMQNPLFASIMQMAKSRLPTSMQHAPFQGTPPASPAQQQTVQTLARRRPEY